MKINFRNKLSGETVLVIGIVFTVTGVSLWGLTGYNILTREQTLSDTNLCRRKVAY
jgi:CHASE3 domain sensor protein